MAIRQAGSHRPVSACSYGACGRAMAKTYTKRTRLRSEDFKIPKMISDEEFILLCKNSKIDPSPNTKKRLDELVEAFADLMCNERPQSRASDRKRLKDARSDIKNATAVISKLGPPGRNALTSISHFIAPMLAAHWMNERFPDDDYAPQKSWVPHAGLRPPTHQPSRARMYFIEEESLNARVEFVYRRPAQTVGAALNDLEKGLVAALRALDLQPGARGGQKPLAFRHDLIINLAEIWDDMGKQVSPTENSEFITFCTVVAGLIGWPEEGMGAAIPKATKDWRNLTQKQRR
jgi:hypothetical protein